MNDKQLPPLPTLLHTRVVDGIPCISVSEHEYLMREYALQAIALTTQAAEVTDEFLYELWDEKFRSWIGGEQFESIARTILALRPVQSTFCEYCGGNDEEPVDHCMDCTRPVQVPMTDREIELIDGMIAAQLDHAQRCDAIGNRVMAEKQKGWDMERVELLRRLRAYGITAQSKKEQA